MDGNSYLVIVRQALFNLNSYKTLLAEDQIECHGVKVFSRPRVFGGKQLVESRDQVGHSVKLGISWDGYTGYLYVIPPTGADVERLSYLQITCGEPYSPYSLFRKSTRPFKLNDPCPARGRVTFFWTNEKIQELRQRLGYVSPHLVKKTFDNSTQEYLGLRHEQEVMPKKSAVARFPSLSDLLNGISRNKETFSVDLLEDNHAGKKRSGLVFYGMKPRILAYYRLGSKDPISALNLDALIQFIVEHRIPIMIITNSDGVLGAGKKGKKFLRRLFIPLQLSKPDKHNQNPVECAIQNLKDGLINIRNACGTVVLEYHWEAMEYLFSLNNHVARESLGNRLLFEDFWGETPDTFMIRFKFWDPVYYRNWTDKSGKVLMNPGRFVGFSWSIGDLMTFKVIQCNEDPCKRNIVLYRGIVVLRSTTATGYNYSLAPNSDAYFPYVQVEGGAFRKTTPLGHHGTVDPPNIAIPEGGGKRRNILSSSPKSVESDRYAVAPIETVADVPGIADGFYVLVDLGYAN